MLSHAVARMTSVTRPKTAATRLNGSAPSHAGKTSSITPAIGSRTTIPRLAISAISWLPGSVGKKMAAGCGQADGLGVEPGVGDGQPAVGAPVAQFGEWLGLGDGGGGGVGRAGDGDGRGGVGDGRGEGCGGGGGEVIVYVTVFEPWGMGPLGPRTLMITVWDPTSLAPTGGTKAGLAPLS